MESREKNIDISAAGDGGMNNACIAVLLNGLHHGGIGPIIAKADKEIAAGKSAKKEEIINY